MLNLLYTPTWCFWQKQFVRIEIVYLVLVFKRKSTLLGFYQSNIIYKHKTGSNDKYHGCVYLCW